MQLNTTFNSGSGTFNVNPGPNPPKPGPVTGLVGIPKGKALTPTEIANLETTLRALILEDDPQQRAYGILDSVGVTASNTDPNTETLPNGTTVVTRGPKPTWTALFTGSLGDHLGLRKFQDSQGSFDWLRIHSGAKQYLSGTMRKIGGVEHLAGISMAQVWVNDRDEAQPDAVAKTRMMFTPTDSRQYNEGIAYVELDFDPADVLIGFADVTLIAAPTGTPGQWLLRALHGTGRADLHEIFATELAAGTAWRMINRVPNSSLNGLAIPFAVANVANGWTLSATVASPNYPALGGRIEINLAKPSVLSAAPIDVEGIEGVPTYVEAT